MRRRAFSLLELTVVIGILGILVAASSVGFSRQQAKARDARRVSDIHKLNIGVQSYIADKGAPESVLSYGTGCTNPSHRSCGGTWDYSSSPDPATGTQQFMLFLRPYVDGIFPIDPINDGTGDAHYSGSGYAYAYHYYLPYCHWDTSKGTLYPALSKMETEGLIFSTTVPSKARTRKMYSITEKGKIAFRTAAKVWNTIIPALRQNTTL